MIRKTLGYGAVCAAAVLTLTSCTGDAKPPSGTAAQGVRLTAAQILDKVSQKTDKINTYRIDFSLKTSADGGARMRGSMLRQNRPNAISLNYKDVFVGKQHIPGGMKMILVHGRLYLNIPFLNQMSGGRPWMKFSGGDLKKGAADLEEFTSQTDLIDLATMAKFATASDDAKAVGKEVVGGVQTTHYTGTASSDDDTAGLSAKKRAQADDVFGAGKLTFNLWVDDQQLPRKLQLDTAPGAKEKTNMTLTFGDFNERLNITAPPADQVGKPPRGFTFD